MYVWTYTFSAILRTRHAVVRDTTNNPVSKDFGGLFVVLRARIWGLLHGYGWLPVKNEPEEHA